MEKFYLVHLMASALPETYSLGRRIHRRDYLESFAGLACYSYRIEITCAFLLSCYLSLTVTQGLL